MINHWNGKSMDNKHLKLNANAKKDLECFEDLKKAE